MAKLVGEQGLSLEIRCVEPLHGWIGYEVLFLWRGKSILDSTMLRHGVVTANQCLDELWDESSLSQIIRQALETGKSGMWEPLEPDIEILVCRLRTDLFTLMASVDTHTLEDCDSYTGDTISLRMYVTRQALTDFCTGFEKEYREALP